MSEAISAQGTIIARAPAATPTSFTDIAELRNITLPSLTRKEIDTTPHNDVEEAFVMGIRRKTPMTFEIGFLPGNATHDHLTGLIKAQIDNSRDIYRCTFPEGSGAGGTGQAVWKFSGYVANVSPKAPVDDGLTADVTIRPTGTMAFSFI